ncbi:hypothetical protein CT19431_MP80373 [Cupriavidus taiwanensis]|nr:hypothetical protein CT19431_MP80373 [Cupriavidus taiwanensis]
MSIAHVAMPAQSAENDQTRMSSPFILLI